MSVVVPILFVAVPLAIGVWLWWSSRKIGGNRTSYKSRRVSHSPQRFGKIQGETTHKDYTDGSAQSKSDPPKVPLYNGEPLKVTPLGDNRKAQTETTLVDRVERPPREVSRPLPYTMQATNNALTTGADRVERSSDSVAAIVQHPMLRPVVGDVATVRFEKGARYLLADGRVMECVGFRGNKERRAAFMDYGELEYWPQKRTEHADYFLWNVIRLDNGVEVCDRGRIRADHLASEQQAAEWAKMVKEREDGQRAYWAERKAKRERDAKRLAELEKLAKEKGWE